MHISIKFGNNITKMVDKLINKVILEIINNSIGNIRFIFDVNITYKEDIYNAIETITKYCDVF